VVFFDLIVRTRCSLHTDGDPDQFISGYEAVIVCEGEDGVRRKVGRIVARRVNAGVASDYGESLFEVCDCHSQEMHELHTLLYKPGTYLFKKSLMRRFLAVQPDLLVVEYVVLNPKWRGLKVGLLAVRRLVDLVGGGCGLVVADISPLLRDAHKALKVPERWLPEHKTDDESKAATVKLRRYFRRMGFERLGRTPYYILPTALKTPNADELLRLDKPV
jgi:hypothetical protein